MLGKTLLSLALSLLAMSAFSGTVAVVSGPSLAGTDIA